MRANSAFSTSSVIRHCPQPSSAASAASAGLFLARVVLEATHRPWPRALIVTVGLLAVLVGLVLARRLASRSTSLVIGHWSLGIATKEQWPALLLLAYVLWPQRDPLAAASIAALSFLVWLLSHTFYRGRSPTVPPSPHLSPSFIRRAGLLADVVTFVVALVVYVTTAAPDVLPADFGEFQLVAALLGVAHPFGFPLYTLMGHLFIRFLPWGIPAYRLNLMSALLAAGTLVLVARATRLWARRLSAAPADAQHQAQASPLLTPATSTRSGIAEGLAAALALGTATTFWAQATIANVRTLAVFFAALALYALARFATAANEKNEKKANGALILLGLALGLGGGHYPPLAFVSLFFVIYVLLTDPSLAVQFRRWWRPLLAGLLGFLLPLVYLPIRGAMGAPLAPEDLDTLAGFLHHFLGLGFAGDMFAFANAADLPHRLALLPTLFPFQFNLLLLAAALLGLLGLLWRDWRLFVLLAGSLIVHTFVTITYRAPQTVEYLMPAYLPIAIAVGLLPSLSSVLRPTAASTRGRTSHVSRSDFQENLVSSSLAAAVLWAGLLNGWTHAASFVELAGDRTARETVGPLLEQAPADTLILADWRWATPLWYLQQVEGLRPDVEVRYVYPVAEEEYWETWLRHVQEEKDTDPGRPLLLTHFYEFPGYIAEPWESGFLIRPRPVMEPAAPLAPVTLTFGDRVRLVGYSLRRGTGDRFRLGQVAEFVLAWQPTGALDPPPSFTLRLVDGEGRDRAQADRALSADSAPGEVRFERLSLPLYPTLSPGRYQVTLGVYTITGTGFENLSADDGNAAVALTDLELTPACLTDRPSAPSYNSQFSTFPTHAPFTLHRQATPFAGGPTLVGVDYDRSIPDVLRIYLHWQCRPDRFSETCQVWQARVRTSDGLETAASLPPIPSRSYQTIGMDLPGLADRDGPLWLALTGVQGEQAQAAGPWGWPIRDVRLPTPALDARFVLLGDEMAIVGFTSKQLRPSPSTLSAGAQTGASGETGDRSGRIVVDVTLVALRPLTSDDATSVRLMDAGGRWLARHDMQPGLSAVPTLKWIQGSQVVDRHLLMLPEDFASGEVRATLVAYERFRMAPLPPMDGRFSEVPLGTWTLP